MPRERGQIEARLARLQTLLDEIERGVQVGTWEWDVASGRLTWSDELYRLYGIEPGSVPITFETYLERIYPEDRMVARQILRSAYRSGAPFAFDHRVVWSDGTIRYLHARGRLVRDPNGAPKRMMGTSQDVTDRKQIEQELRDIASAERFLAEASTLLDDWLDEEGTLTSLARLTVPRIADWCAVDMLRDDGSIRRVAAMHQDQLRLDQLRAAGLHYTARLDDPTGIGMVIREGQTLFSPTVTEEMLQALATDSEQLRLLCSLGLRSGMVVPLTARGRNLGAISLAVAESGRAYTAADVAIAESLARRAALALDNARLYQAEQAARAQAESALRSRDEFIAMVSHDLRNPLTVLRGSAQLIERQSAYSERTVGAIVRQAELLDRLIDDLVDAARFQSEQPTVRLEMLDLVEEVQLAVREAQAQTSIHTVRIVAPEAPISGRWDRVRVSQILQNLLTNAIKYSPGGGTIVARVEDAGMMARVTISDSGIGISADELPRLFERFYRGSGEGRATGLGLGLFIARSLVEAHGGQIWAESEGPGRGTTVGFTLPYRPPSSASKRRKRRKP